MGQNPRNGPNRQNRPGSVPQRSKASYRYQPPSRDYRGIFIGAIVGLGLAGIILVAYLLGVNSAPRSGGQSASTTGNTNTSQSTSTTPTAVPDDAPRITPQAFKTLYDSLSTRPVILDVRPLAEYQQGHIKGAISFPGSDVDKRAGELPKDKLIVAYCN